MTEVGHDIKDAALAAKGVLRIEWAEREMPVLRSIRSGSRRSGPSREYGWGPVCT